jgi:hypothetical protein
MLQEQLGPQELMDQTLGLLPGKVVVLGPSGSVPLQRRREGGDAALTNIRAKQSRRSLLDAAKTSLVPLDA